jgi:hypothetical protein
VIDYPHIDTGLPTPQSETELILERLQKRRFTNLSWRVWRWR